MLSRLRMNPKIQRLTLPLAKVAAKRFSERTEQVAREPYQSQRDTLAYLLHKATNTRFGKDHGFNSILKYEDFRSQVPLRDYEAFIPYINRIKAGEQNILWPAQPIYFAATSATTSGRKYVPITRDFLTSYRRSGLRAMCMYIAETQDVGCVAGKILNFTFNAELDRIDGIPVRPISGIAQEDIPRFFRGKFLPGAETDRIEDFERKLDMIVQESLHWNVTTIAGVPSWVQLYFNKLREQTGKVIKDIFPNFSLRVHGAVNDGPYRKTLEASIGKKVNTWEIYPASEGFIAFQDSQKEPGLLLNLQGGIFYEFVPADEISAPDPTRVSLEGVEMGVNYVVILNTNAGLWGYHLGDTVQFVSRKPHRLIVMGRTAEFISVAGEHMLLNNVENAVAQITSQTGVKIIEFTVAPNIDQESGLPFHEWFIEFEEPPADLDRFSEELNTAVRRQNLVYDDFCEARNMLSLKIRGVRRGGFVQYMKSIGKMTAQNKVPHLSNNRKIADALLRYVLAGF